MKNYDKFIPALFTIFCFFSLQVLAQSAAVDIESDDCPPGNGNCFYGVEPQITSFKYRPLITSVSGIPSGAVKTYIWTLTGGAFTLSTNANSEIPYIIWENKKNYISGNATHSLRLKVKWTWSGGSHEVESLTQPIEVKYIGNVGTITINGSGYSGTAVLACGSNTLAISVPTVETDGPFTYVTYYWYYPSGWSGPATTTTPSVTATPSASSQGTLKVEAKRADGNLIKSNQVQVNRQLPIINSTSINNLVVCSGTTQSISASGTNADSFVWTPSSNVTVNGNSSPQNVSGAVNIGATNQGTVTVQAYSSACGTVSSNSIVRNVSFGTPTISNPIQWLFDSYSNMWQCSNIITPYFGTSYTWTLVSGSATLVPNINDCYVSTTGGALVAITASNTCGTSTATYYDIPAAEGYRMMAYPNPTKNVLTLELKSEDVSSIDIYSKESAERVKSIPVKDFVKGNASEEGPKVELNVSDLPRGIYYLHVNPGTDSKQKVQIIQIRLE